MNTRVANDIVDGFYSLHAMLLSAAKSPLSRPDNLSWVSPESEGPGEWVMAYSRPTLLRVPLSSAMEWEGKKTLIDIVKDNPHFDIKNLVSKRANKFAVNIYFALKLDTLHLADALGDEDEGQSVVNNNKRAQEECWEG